MSAATEGKRGSICSWGANVAGPHSPWLGFGAAAQGKFVTFGVTRGCIAVASPVSSITWLIAP